MPKHNAINFLNVIFLSFLFVSLLNFNQIQCSNSLKQSPTEVKQNENQNEFVRQVSELDVSKLSEKLLANIDHPCVNKFLPMIKVLPTKVQSVLVDNFIKTTNSTDTACCNSDTLIGQLSDVIDQQYNDYSRIVTDYSQKGKNSLGCIKTVEIFYNSTGYNHENGTSSQENDEMIKDMLLETNSLNSNLSKCMVGLKKVSLSNIALMCSSPSLIEKTFSRNTQNQFIAPKPRQDTDLTIFDNCYSYVSSWSRLTQVSMDIFIDLYNFVISIDQCNYFSPFFGFNSDESKDPLYPKEVSTFKSQFENKTYSDLLNQLYDCILPKNITDPNLLLELKTPLINAEKQNPRRLASHIGRDHINFNIIQNTFNLNDFPTYYITCKSNICKAYCPTCENLKWDNNKVVIIPTTNLDVICCNGICAILVSVEEDDDGTIRRIDGSEIFAVDPIKRIVNDYDRAKIANARTCINSMYKPDSYDNIEFKNAVDDVLKAKNNIEIDPNYVMLLNTEVKFNSNYVQNKNSTTLLNFIYQNITQIDDEHVYLSCFNATCTLSCSTCEDKTSELLPINTLNITIAPSSSPYFRSQGKYFPPGPYIQEENEKTKAEKERHLAKTFIKRALLHKVIHRSFMQVDSMNSQQDNIDSTKTNTEKNQTISLNNLKNPFSWNSGLKDIYNDLHKGVDPIILPLYEINIRKKYIKYFLNKDITHSNTASKDKSILDADKPIQYDNFLIRRHVLLYDNYGLAKFRYNYYRPEVSETKSELTSPEYSPDDWFIDYQKPIDILAYNNLINQKLNEVKVFVDCCSRFCILYIDSFNDDKATTKRRVYIDVIQRKKALLDVNSMTLNQKKCLVKNIFESTQPGTTNLALNSFKECNIKTSFDTLPTKTSCNQSILGYCVQTNYQSLLQRLLGFVQSSEYTNKVCKVPIHCEHFDNNNITTEQKLTCGNLLKNKLIDSGMKVSLSSLSTPCSELDERPVLLQQERVPYLDTNSLSETEKQELNKIVTFSQINADNTNVVIDGNTQNSTDTTVEDDLQLISDYARETARTLSSSFINVSNLVFALVIALFL